MPLDELKRREFITLLSSAAAAAIAWPLVARTEPSELPAIWFLHRQ